VQEAIRGFLRFAVESATEEGAPPGCLLICIAPLVHDAEVRALVQRASADMTALVERRLRDGVGAGQLPKSFPSRTRARQVVDFTRGLTLHAQFGASRDTLIPDAEEAAALVVAPPARLAPLRGRS
jgi:hypothetical protein